MTAFTKGQLVTLFQNWDHKGTVNVVDLIVYSCGKKQMVLVNAAGDKFGGANFRPQEEQYSFGRVTPRMSREDTEAYALKLGAEIVASEKERMESRLTQYPDDVGFCNAMRRGLSELHEPRVRWNEGA